MFLDLISMNQKFIFRLSSVHFKYEQNNMESNDCIVSIFFDKTRINATAKCNPKAANKMVALESLNLRFVRIKSPSGAEKVMATNLKAEEFSTDEISYLYNMRWGVETVYDDLKNKLEIENFTGTKDSIIMQDIFATVLLSNIINDMIIDVSKKISQTYKHEMQLNRSFSFGILKVGLFDVFLTKTYRKRTKALNQLKKDMLTQLLPIRPGRAYYRPTGLKSKYSNVRKRTY